jgi:ferredoxin--NADP+ reductase
MDDVNIERVIDVHRWNSKLFSFKTTRSPSFRFVPGQFSRVGVKVNEKVVMRPYSMVSCDYDDHLEFLSIVVPDGELTTTLSTIQVGDKVFVDKRGLGYLTVDQFTTPINRLILLSTGTGIAPFISIIRSLTLFDRVNEVELIHSVREESEMVYQGEIAAVPRVKYTPLVTRDVTSPYHNVRIPAYLNNNESYFFNHPDDKFMLCGNPDMVRDTRVVLNEHGLKVNRRSEPGQYAVENAF